MKRVGVVLVWVLAAVGTASITLAAVSQVGGQVTEQATGPIDSAELAAARAAAAAPAAVATETISPASDGATTSTVAWIDTGSTSPALDVGTTAPALDVGTTAPAATSTPTPTAAASEQVTTALIGGTVTVLHSGSTVTLVSAVPNSGFWGEVEASGPTLVSVEFESSSHGSVYEAKVDNGKLDIQTDEHEEDGD